MSRPTRSVCAACGNDFPSSPAPTPAQTLELMNVLRSNSVPPNLGSFQSAILAAPTELARYDAEIDRLQTVLARLISERTTLATYTERCRSALSPIRRVPTELWANIFDLCSPYTFPTGYNLSDSTTPQQEVNRISNWHLLQLSQVSSLWHKIAMGTPKLWSTIALDTSLWDETTVSHSTLLSLLDLSLKRGENHPLVMDIGVREDDPQRHAVMILLSLHAPRWKDVYFYSDLDSAQLLTRAKGNLERLETLDVTAEWKGVDIFQIAPRLRTVLFRGRVGNVPNLPWAQIHEFTYVGDTLDTDPFNFLSILGRCRNLITFTSRVTLCQLPVGTIIPAVSSDVEYLSFELAPIDITRPVVARIFETLTLPALRSLAVGPRDDHPSRPDWDTEQFVALADRSSFHSHLTRLEIEAVKVTDNGLLRCLAVLPCLVDLVVSDSADEVVITDTLLRGLTRNHDDPTFTLVPSLEFLCFNTVLGFSDSCCRDLVTSRLPMGVGDYFETRVWWLPGRQREFPTNLLSEIADLDHEGDFRFKSGPPPTD
ncbi:hypothetical protein DFH06DRAFT_282915 [Mycena polygramma]|nr:hypothetical protein DFH06DRAFT_282915 [Mycena polygramma]